MFQKYELLALRTGPFVCLTFLDKSSFTFQVTDNTFYSPREMSQEGLLHPVKNIEP
jgi:hypothetical protein